STDEAFHVNELRKAGTGCDFAEASADRRSLGGGWSRLARAAGAHPRPDGCVRISTAIALDLRPLTLAELLDRSFSLYRHHFWLFVGIMAVPSVFGLAGGVLLQVLNAGMTGFASSTKPPTSEQLLTMFVPFVIGLVLFSLLYGLTYMFALGATTVAVSDLYLGRDTTLGTAYASTRRHILRLLLLMLWTMLRIGGVLVGGMTIVVVGGTLLGFVSPILTVL